MPRIRWARRLQDGTEQHGIECICGGDLMAADEPGVWRCHRCGSELRLGHPPPSDALTGERATVDPTANDLGWAIWRDEQRLKHRLARPGSRSSRRGRFRKRSYLTKKRRHDEV
ncbi:MAG TPA: hypothetical protein VIL95_08990 [Bacillota bacterium]